MNGDTCNSNSTHTSCYCAETIVSPYQKFVCMVLLFILFMVSDENLSTCIKQLGKYLIRNVYTITIVV